MKSIYMIILGCCLISEIYIRINVVGGSITEFNFSDGQKKSWCDAMLDCKNKDMELAMIDTEEKHLKAIAFIENFANVQHIFIGLSLDRTVDVPPYTYRYLNCLVPTYLPWTNSEPNKQSTDFCIRMQRSPNFGFRTTLCSKENDYLCTVLTENQTSQHQDSTFRTDCDRTTKQTDTSTITDYDSTTKQIHIETVMEDDGTTQQKDTTTVAEGDSTTQQTDTTTETDDASTTQQTYITTVTGNVQTTQQMSTTVEAGYDGSTTQADGTSVQRQDGCLLDCFCPCSDYTNRWLYLMCGNYTREEMKEIMTPELHEMQENLKVDPKNTSRYIRSLTSASDSRISSLAMGSVGIAVLSTIAFVIVLLDCNKFLESCRQSLCKKK